MNDNDTPLYTFDFSRMTLTHYLTLEKYRIELNENGTTSIDSYNGLLEVMQAMCTADIMVSDTYSALETFLIGYMRHLDGIISTQQAINALNLLKGSSDE